MLFFPVFYLFLGALEAVLGKVALNGRTWHLTPHTLGRINHLPFCVNFNTYVVFRGRIVVEILFRSKFKSIPFL